MIYLINIMCDNLNYGCVISDKKHYHNICQPLVRRVDQRTSDWNEYILRQMGANAPPKASIRQEST